MKNKGGTGGREGCIWRERPLFKRLVENALNSLPTIPRMYQFGRCLR